MLLNILTIAVMSGLGIYTYATAHFAETRRVALVPFGVCGMEMLAAGLLSTSAFPLLTVLLCALRMAVALCCVGAIRQDRRKAHRREARKAAAARRLRCAEHPLQALPPRESARSRGAVGCA